MIDSPSRTLVIVEALGSLRVWGFNEHEATWCTKRNNAKVVLAFKSYAGGCYIL